MFIKEFLLHQIAWTESVKSFRLYSDGFWWEHASLSMTKGWFGQCLLPCISWSTLYMEVRDKLSLWLGITFRTVKIKLWVVFKTSIKEICPRVPKDVIYWRIVVSWIVIFVINVCTCDDFPRLAGAFPHSKTAKPKTINPLGLTDRRDNSLNHCPLNKWCSFINTDIYSSIPSQS